MNAFVRPAKHTFVAIGEIDLSHTIRPYNASVVAELAQSIRAIGLQTPLTCIVRDGRCILVVRPEPARGAARHRGEQAPVRIVDFDDVDAQLWQLSENLHRAELTKLEYDKQVVRYAELLKVKLAEETDSPTLASSAGRVRLRQTARTVGAVSADEESRQVTARPPAS